MSSTPELSLHPDRLLPSEPGVRSTARQLYESVKELPIIAARPRATSVVIGGYPVQQPNLFVDHPGSLRQPDAAFPRRRAIRARGGSRDNDGRAITRCVPHLVFALECLPRHSGAVLARRPAGGIFGVKVRPSAETADQIYDQIASCLDSPEFKPRALYEKFKIELLATTDDPCDDLAAHQFLRDDENWQGRVIPTFRPDKYLEPAQPNWNADVDRLAEVSGIDAGDYDGYIAAMENRRQYFKDNGAVSADHSHLDARTDTLEVAEAERIYASARKGEVSEVEATALRRHLVSEMARMACDDGLVMTLHPGVRRNHHMATSEKYGADVGPTFRCRWSSPRRCARC